jgi:hypothetical protein
MKFDYARKFIQETVKEALGVTTIPKQASKPNLVKKLAEIGLTEPYDKDQCKEIAQMIVNEVLKEQSALTVVDESCSGFVETMEEEILETNNLPAIDWQAELTGIPAEAPQEEKHTHTKQDSSELTYPVDDAKRGMVSYKASEMGISLASTEIDVIASRVDASSSSFTQTISDIESALIAYVDYQQSQESHQVRNMLTRVSNRVIEKNRAVKESLTTGVNKFTSALEVAEQQQKSELSAILTRLKTSRQA